MYILEIYEKPLLLTWIVQVYKLQYMVVLDRDMEALQFGPPYICLLSKYAGIISLFVQFLNCCLHTISDFL